MYEIVRLNSIPKGEFYKRSAVTLPCYTRGEDLINMDFAGDSLLSMFCSRENKTCPISVIKKRHLREEDFCLLDRDSDLSLSLTPLENCIWAEKVIEQVKHAIKALSDSARKSLAELSRLDTSSDKLCRAMASSARLAC